MDYVIVIVSSLLSGILGVLISAHYYSKNEKKKIQVKVIIDLFANRHQVYCDEFSKALNSIPIVFSESEDIVRKYHDFHDRITGGKGDDINKDLFDFLSKLLIHTKLSKNGINDATIRKVFGASNRNFH